VVAIIDAGGPFVGLRGPDAQTVVGDRFDPFRVGLDHLALALPDATALAMFRSGELHLVSMHLLSLSNMQQLVDRLAQRKVPAAPKPA
jgi:hypothetical protein